MSKSKQAPEYASTSFDTGGLFGSSTTSKNGTTFTPTDWQKNTMNVIGNNMPSTLNSMLSNDYSNDPNFQAYQNNFDRQMSRAYDSNVLSQLANKGLMRSSGLQAATNSFNNTMNDNYTNLMDNYYNRQANNLSNMQNVANNLYNYISGITQGSQSGSNSISSYNLQKYQAEQQAKANNNALWASLANTAGSLAGAAAGGPIGSAIGGKIAGTVANAAS